VDLLIWSRATRQRVREDEEVRRAGQSLNVLHFIGIPVAVPSDPSLVNPDLM